MKPDATKAASLLVSGACPGPDPGSAGMTTFYIAVIKEIITMVKEQDCAPAPAGILQEAYSSSQAVLTAIEPITKIKIRWKLTLRKLQS